MDNTPRPLTDLTNGQLLAEVKALAASERQATARLIASLAELDARRLYLGEGFSSLFTYCTQCLHLSEHAAYNRIEAARAARRWPEILELLADGSVTLTTVSMVARHLTAENYRKVLESTRHKSKREVERIVAALHPRPDVPAAIRKLPSPGPPDPPKQVTPDGAPFVAAGEAKPDLQSASSPTSDVVPAEVLPTPRLPSRPAVVAPLAPERYKFQFTAGRPTHDKLRRAQDLLRHEVPTGDPAEIFDRALTLLVAHLERTKLASAKRPREPRAIVTQSRNIPSAVKREVWERDGGRCGFVGTEGRCLERCFLEFHHVMPYALGGRATRDNIALRCRAHNLYEGEITFGERPVGGAENPGGQVLQNA